MKPLTLFWVPLLCLGCVVRYTDNSSISQSEDVVAWGQSSEARRGYIVLGSDVSRSTAIDITRKMIALDDDENVERICLIINSNGGDTSAFRTIYNAIRFSNKPVDTLNVGNCYSAACSIFAAATGKRYAYPNAHFMVHKPSATGGSVRRYRELIDFEIDFYESVLKKSGLPADWFPLSGRDRYFTASQARTLGFVDEIVEQLPKG